MKYFIPTFFVTLTCLVMSVALAQDAEKADKPKLIVSAFAPVKDAESQLKYFIDKIGRDLTDKEEFGEAQAKRVGLDASTVLCFSFDVGSPRQRIQVQGIGRKVN